MLTPSSSATWASCVRTSALAELKLIFSSSYAPYPRLPRVAISSPRVAKVVASILIIYKTIFRYIFVGKVVINSENFENFVIHAHFPVLSPLKLTVRTLVKGLHNIFSLNTLFPPISIINSYQFFISSILLRDSITDCIISLK